MMDEALRRRLETLKRSAPISWQRVERGYTAAERWLVRFSDGSSAFAKVGASPSTSDFLRVEHRRYQQLHAHFMPQLISFDADLERPILLLEDLSSAAWPPPWQQGDVERVVETLRQVAATRPLPEDLPSLEEEFGVSGSDDRASSGWGAVLRDPGAFLSLGLCSTDWLSRAQRRLLDAQNEAVLSGDDLVHNDVRSDNLCLLPDRVVLIDWNVAGRGNGAFDLAFAAPSLCLEGGPLPEKLVGDDGRLAAVVSGFFAARAGLPKIADAPRVRWIQLQQLRIALPWVARVLDLPPLDLLK
jgi:Phosphotransferase enzyme family